MKVAEVVAEVVAAMERLMATHAFRVVAKVRVLVGIRRMLVLVVSNEIGATLERLRIAAWREAEDGIVAAANRSVRRERPWLERALWIGYVHMKETFCSFYVYFARQIRKRKKLLDRKKNPRGNKILTILH